MLLIIAVFAMWSMREPSPDAMAPIYTPKSAIHHASAQAQGSRAVPAQAEIQQVAGGQWSTLPAPISNLPNFPQMRADPILAQITRGAPVVDSRNVWRPDGSRSEAIIYQTEEKYPYVRVERAWSPSGELLSEEAMVADHLLARVMDASATDATIARIQATSLEVRERMWAPGYLLISGPAVTLDALDQIYAQLEETVGDAIAFAEPDRMVFATLTPNDPLLSTLWGLEANGGPDIDAPQGWNLIHDAPDVVVAVIDSGVEYTHPDLAANIWVNTGEIPGNGIDDDGNGLIDDVHGYDFYNNDGDPMEDHYHGTHVSGTIAAVGNNGVGVTGVAWQAQIMAIKFLSSTGSGTLSGAINSILYSGEMGAQLSNNSWGGAGSSPFALEIAIDLNRFPFITSAGNNAVNIDQSPYFPAGSSQPHVITVAAHGQNDALGWFSNYGAVNVDLSAPGVSIRSTFRGASYNYLSGTSMAAPHVSGVVALLLQANPALGFAEVKNILMSSVVPASYLNGKVASGGKLNLNQALGLLNVDPPVITSELTASAVVGNAFNYQITATNNPASFDATVLPAGLAVDSDGLISGAPTVSGTFNVAISATNFAATDQQTLVLTIDHLAPVITSNFATQSEWGAPFSYFITADNGPDSFDASGMPDGLSINTSTGEISGQSTDTGEFAVTISATNIIGADVQTLTLNILPPEAPVITSPLIATGEIDQPFSYAITATHFPTAFDATGLPTGLDIDPSSGVISGAPTETGEFAVALSASNPGGVGEATLTLTINLPDAPVITANSLYTLTESAAFTQQIDATNAPDSYAANGLPDGLSIDALTGHITGAPTTPGIYAVELQATNQGGSGVANVSFDVLPLPPVITSATTGETHDGDAFAYQITASNNPDSFAAVGLPDGLTIDAETGAITGATSQLGTHTVTISAANRGGVGSATLFLQVLPQPPVITSALALSAEAGEPVNYQITADNDPTSFGAANLPDGLTINTGSGLISGVVLAADVYPVTISATNAGGESTQTLAITIEEGPARIVSFAPTSVDPGAVVTITGVGFTDASAVIFSKGGQETPAISFTVVSDTELSAFAPFIALTPGDQVRITVITPHGLATTLPPDTVEVFENIIATEPLSYRVHAGGAANSIGDDASFVIQSEGVVTADGGGIYYVRGGGVLDMTHLSNEASVYYTPSAYLLDAPIVNDSPAFLSVPHIRSIVLASALWINQTPQVLSPMSTAVAVGEFLDYELLVHDLTGLSIAVGALPNGLSFDPLTRRLTGYPTTPGDYDIDFTLTNAGGVTNATLSLSVTGNAIPVLNVARTYALLSGQAFLLQLTAANAPDSFGATGLPDGLSIDELTGLISGAPTASGAYDVTLSATNALGSGERVVTFYVDLAPLSITDFSPAIAPEGATITVQGDGFLDVQRVRLISRNNQLVTIESPDIASDNVLSFTAPRLSLFNFEGSPLIVETGEWAAVTARSDDFPGLGVVYVLESGETLSNFFAQDIIYVKSGGVASLATSTQGIFFLEDGATLDMANQPNPVVTLFRSPNASVINVGGEDSVTTHDMPSMRFYDIGKFLSIYNLPTITPNNAAGEVGQAFVYQIQLTISEDISEYGATGLPAGLSIDTATGEITGAPMEAGEFIVTLTALGEATGLGSAEVVFTIAPPTLSELNSAFRIEGHVGASLTYQILASNNPSAYALSTLPNGLSFDAVTGALSGVPTTAGAYPVELTLTNANGANTVRLLIAIDAPIPVITQLPTDAQPGLTTAIAGEHLAEVTTMQLLQRYPYGTSPLDITPTSVSDNQIVLTTPLLDANDDRPNLALVHAPGGSTVSLTDDVITVSDAQTAQLLATYFVENGGVLTGHASGARVYVAQGGELTLASGSRHLVFAENGARVTLQGSQFQTIVFHAPNALIEAEGDVTLVEVPDLAPSFVTNGFTVSQLPFVTSSASANGYLNIPFFFSITATNSPTSFNADALPAGLAIHPATGVISGSPGATGTYTIELTVSNAHGDATQAFTLHIGNALDYWIAQNLGEGATSETVDVVDTNGDNIPDLLNYALVTGLGAEADTRARLPTYAAATDLSATFSFRRLQGAGVGNALDGYTIGGVSYVVYWSPDMADWQTGGIVLEQVGAPVNNGDGSETVTVRAVDSLADCPSFFQLEVMPAD